MREIVLDTETTGFDAEKDDRIVEIGALELFNHLPTGGKLHLYINPERSMPQEAFEVHGLGDEFLRDKPKFAEVAQQFIDFIGEDAIDVLARNAGHGGEIRLTELLPDHDAAAADVLAEMLGKLE